MDDASIPLQVQSPQIANPIATYGKLLSLRTMQAQAAQQQQQAEQQQQMFPEQLKAAQLQNQAHQRTLDSQNIVKQSWIDAKGDLDKTEQLARDRGALPDHVMALGKQRLAQQHAYAQNKELDLKNEEKRGDLLAGRTDAFLKNPDREKLWQTFWEEQEKEGNVTTKQHADILAQAPEFPGDEAARNLGYGFRSHSQIAAGALKDQQTEAANARATRDKAAAGEANQKTDAQRTKDAATLLGTASDPEDYAQKLYSLDPKIRDKFKGVAGGDEFDQTAIQKAADRVAMSPEERTRADQAEATGARTEAHQRVLEGQGAARVADAKIRTGLAVDRAGKEKSGELTPYQKQRELDAIDAQEQGKGSTPGLHTQRQVIGTYLKNGVGADGKPLSGAQRDVYQKQLSGLNDSVQQLQVKKASLHGITPPPDWAIARTAEGKTVTDPRGHVWKKQDGIVYFVK